MNLSRIGKLLITIFLGQGITVVTQLLVPPFFLRFYNHGLEVYGEWLVLSASVSYLATLNYGVQTYANNQMTILYNRGDVEEAKTVQASALRLLLLLILIFSTIGSVVFFVPAASLLHLKYVGPEVAALTLFLLIVQVAVNMLFSLLTNSYMAVGKQHRGNYYASGQRLFSVLCLSGAIYFQSSFAVLAGVQLGSLLLFGLFVFIDIRITAPMLLPSLSYGNWQHVGKIIKPSGHFGLISFANFLTIQGPLILIQRVLGPAAVAVFALVRVVFIMSRQILSIATYAIGQDITLLVGQRKWQELRRLYDLSERIIMFLVPIVSIGSLMMCPIIFTVWLHKRGLYDPLLCFLMAMVSAVMGIKEHKTQFQSSSNQHEMLSIFILTGYVLMLLAAVFTTRAFGLPGFVVTWLIWEIIQTGFIIYLNNKLFPAEIGVTSEPITRLAIFMAFAFAASAVPVWREANLPLDIVITIAIGWSAILGCMSYFVFGMDELRRLLTARLRRRSAPIA